jgi:hypothetical protein
MKLFNLRAQLILPFEYFKNLGSISGKLGKYTAWELQHTYYSGCLFDIDTELSYHEDHAGFNFCIGLLGYGIDFRIYDTRHWNYNTEEWEEYNYDEYFKT